MKKKLNFCKIYLKNNIINFYSIYIVLILIYSTNFILNAALLRLVDFNFKSSDNHVYITGIIMFSIFMSFCAIFVYYVYYKKNKIKLYTYKILGATVFDIIFCFLIETLNVIILSLIFGMVVDFSIFKAYPMFGHNYFLTKNLLQLTILTSLWVPIITFILSSIIQIFKNKYSYGLRGDKDDKIY